MQLTMYTDYSLRVLIYLALTDGEITTISEIAERYGVSKNHLVKVAHNLGKLGYVKTIRGRSGGIQLEGQPGQINLGRVVRDVESNFALVECFDSSKVGCPIIPACTLKGVLQDAQQAFMQVLDSYTLSDLVANKDALKSELGMSPSDPA